MAAVLNVDYRFIVAAVAGVSLALCYAPRFMRTRGIELTRDQFLEAHPEWDWLRYDNLADIVWLFSLLFLYGLAFFSLPRRIELLYLMATFPAALDVNRGLLTIKTGICPFPYRYTFYRYIYANRSKAVGWIQVIGAVGLIAGFLLALLRR